MKSLFAGVLVLLTTYSAFSQATLPKVTVWLYRPATDTSGLPLTLHMDGRELTNLGHGQFFGIQVYPGLRAFSWTSATTAKQVAIPIGPDPQAYLEVTFQSKQPFLFIKALPVDKAIAGLSGLQPVDRTEVFDSGVIIPAQAIQTPPNSPLTETAANPKSRSASVSPQNVVEPVLIVPAPGMQIPGTASVTESRIGSSPAAVPVAKVGDPVPAVATLPSAPASAPLSPANPAARLTSDGTKLRGPQPSLEGGEEALNSPRRFEAFWAPYSFSRWGQMNLHGGELELAVKLTNRFSLIANVGDHRSIGTDVTTGSGFPTRGRVETLTYRLGPRFSIRPNDRLTIFGHASAGRTRVKAIYDFGDGFTLDALGNGLVISGGGGVDIAIKKWLSIRLVQAEYNHNRIDGSTWRDVRIGSGLVFRIK